MESSHNSMVGLTSTNYSIWRPMMEDLLYCSDLYYPIKVDKDATVPNKPEKMTEKEWEIMKRKTLGTIRLWIDDSMYNHVSEETDPLELWRKLEGLYEKKTVHNKVSLIKRLVNLKLETGKSVSEHLSDFQDIINKLTDMKIIFDDEVQALFLLSSVPDRWETLVVSISNSAPNGVLSLDVIKESMLNEEIRRKEMCVDKARTLVENRGRSNSRGAKGRDKSKHRSKSKNGKNTFTCHYCNKPGHIQRFCYKKKNNQRNKQDVEEDGRVNGKDYAADILSIREAQQRISSFIHKTPVLSSETLNDLSGRRLYFKCECFQKGGAFKFRGACNAVFSLEGDQASKGVVTHSSGNHAAAVSLAAKLRGIPAYIVIPKNAPKCKVENVRRYGGLVIWSEATMLSRESTANKMLQETGGVLVHPYNDARIISGQGTISLELLEQVPQLDTIIVPISGGGLISGVTLAAKSINPAIRVLAAEPKGANDAAQSKASGRIVTLPDTNTVADGLRASLGDLTWPVVRDLVDDVIVVDDKEIIEAMKLCYEILKVAVEPSGAIGLAAVLSSSFRNDSTWKDCNNIAIVLSGGNVDLAVLWDSFRQ